MFYFYFNFRPKFYVPWAISEISSISNDVKAIVVLGTFHSFELSTPSRNTSSPELCRHKTENLEILCNFQILLSVSESFSLRCHVYSTIKAFDSKGLESSYLESVILLSYSTRISKASSLYTTACIALYSLYCKIFQFIFVREVNLQLLA